MTEESLFAAALAKQNLADRAAYLDEACAGDANLRRRVEALLHSHEDESFLRGPYIGDLARTEDRTEAETSSGDARQQLALSSGNDERTIAEHTTQEDEEVPMHFLTPSEHPGSLGLLGHYDILERIGKGAFGTVYRAFDNKLHRIVAIKILLTELAASGPARKRFIREAQAGAAIKNEHVVAIYNVEDEHQPPYIVMEYIDGITLQARLERDGPLEVKEILCIGVQMAEGLAAAHRHGKVHRDIKPANILLENGLQRVKITDFGLARAMDDASITQSGVIAGTPMYMSPEQADGFAIDHRSDLFSLGTVLYVMCTGRLPFRASSTIGVLKRVVEKTPRPIREINSEIPQWLIDVVEKLHAKKPEDRYQSAREVADVLARYLGELQLHGQVVSRGIAADEKPGAGALRGANVAGANRDPQVVEAETAPRRRGAGRLTVTRRKFVLAAGVLSLAALAVVYLPPVLRHEAPVSQPCLSLTVDDPELLVEAVQCGTDISPFKAFPVKSASTFRFTLPPGEYEILGSKHGKVCRREFVTLAAGDDRALEWHLSEGWVPLFNGKDLSGWKKMGYDGWSMKEGVLRGVGRSGSPGWLMSEREFTDFELELEYRLFHRTDSGVFLRAFPSGTPYGDDFAEVQLIDEASFPKLAAERRHGALFGRVMTRTPVAVTPGTWQPLRVRVQGSRIQVWLGGTQTVDSELTSLPGRGHIGLQLFPMPVEFKNVRVRGS